MQELILRGKDLYEKMETLKKISVDNANWVTYYLDENTDEKWIEEYPYAEMHGGGPAQLRLLTHFPWEKRGK